MNTIEFIRHAPKENFSSHHKGVEAELTTEAPNAVELFVQSRVKQLQGKVVNIFTSPVDRAYETGYLLQNNLEKKSITANVTVNPLVSSYGLNENKNAINLRDQKMSDKWADGKKRAKDEEKPDEVENYSMINWCNMGFYERNGDGLTHAEVAGRLATFILENSDPNRINNYTIAVSHSGDIEFLLYFLLAERDRIDLHKNELLHYLYKTGGALKPLTGVKFEVNSGFINISYRNEKGRKLITPIPIQTFEKISQAWKGREKYINKWHYRQPELTV